jgi:hypothetical protein
MASAAHGGYPAPAKPGMRDRKYRRQRAEEDCHRGDAEADVDAKRRSCGQAPDARHRR